MNDKCCDNCVKDETEDCPVIRVNPAVWKGTTHCCSEYSPLPDKPGKIEPLDYAIMRDVIVRSRDGKNPVCRSNIDIMFLEKLNELIAAHNGRDGK